MKLIKFDLPINGIKVKNLDELRDNLTDEILTLARSSQLERWLMTRQLPEKAKAVAEAVQRKGSDKGLFLALCEMLDVEVSDGMKPVIALVGDFGAGKSTLFNRLTKSCNDLDHCVPKCHYGNARLGQREYIVIDTPGFDSRTSTEKVVDQAVAGSDIIIFVVRADCRSLSAQSSDVADYLRCLEKPILLVANQCKGVGENSQLVELYELGLGEVISVSLRDDHGVHATLESALDRVF